VSGDGKTYTAPEVPKRIIAHAYAAAALMEFGIKPVGVYADGPGARQPPRCFASAQSRRHNVSAHRNS
jgi:ABC-type Fe3+-citrate transport system substrate-binding protein